MAFYDWGLSLVEKPKPDYDGAIEKYLNATEINPKFEEAYSEWGSALASKPAPDYDGAIEKFGKAMKIDPTDSYTNSKLADAISKEPHPRDGATKFIQMVKREPNDWTGHYILGLLEIKAGDRKTAIRQLQWADKLQAGNQLIKAALQEASK